MLDLTDFMRLFRGNESWADTDQSPGGKGDASGNSSPGKKDGDESKPEAKEESSSFEQDDFVEEIV